MAAKGVEEEEDNRRKIQLSQSAPKLQICIKLPIFLKSSDHRYVEQTKKINQKIKSTTFS
jgi:hypothetical protein